MRSLLPIVLAAVVSSPAAADYYECTAENDVRLSDAPCAAHERQQQMGQPGKIYYRCTLKETRRWSGEPCHATESQVAYDSQTKQPKRGPESRPAIGMTADAALLLPDPWGKPNAVNRTETARGVREQWVYHVGKYERAYLYFQDGRLRSIQAPDWAR